MPRGYLDPFPRGTRVSQRFGAFPGGYNPPGGHTGKDYAVASGTPVRAAADGVIDAARTFHTYANEWLYGPGGGDTLVLNCGDAAPSFGYSHLSRFLVREGDRVRRGQVIALSGNSGAWTTGPHCHVEVLPPAWHVRNGTYGRVDPDRYLTEYETPPAAAPAAALRKDQEMLVITRPKGSSEIWIGNGITRRHIPDVATLQDYQKLATWGVFDIYKDGQVMDYPVAVLGAPV